MLKIQSDRIIIDGHEPTKEQCETMTLLANALAESESFKTVRYESGYAEFEKVGKADELKFAVGAPAPITVIFDSHITKVVYHGPKDIEFTVSGETKTGNAYDGAEYIFTVTLETGYILDTVTLSSTNPDYGTLVDKTDTTFTILASAGGIYQTITLMSKQATSRKSVDLTTLPGWSSLSSGSHSITIVAKADGYRDSEPSAAVIVTKAAEENALAGTWVFNDSIDLSTITKGFSVSFISNSTNYQLLSLFAGSIFVQEMQYDGYVVYGAGGSWTDEAYKTITITSKLSEVENGDTLLTWLQANATKQSTSAPTLISFTIDGTSYQAEEGMTWAEWVESSYNTGGYYIDGTAIMTPEKYIVVANLSSTINDGGDYIINDGSGGGGAN